MLLFWEFEEGFSCLRSLIITTARRAKAALEDKVAVVCDDEGMLKPNEFNRSMPGGYGGVFGPFFVCGLGVDDFVSLTPEQMQVYKKQFHQAELLLGVKGNTPVTLRVEPFKKRDGPKKERDKGAER